MNTSEIIKSLRKEKKLTQEQLGDLIGVQKSAIAKYESGRVENLKRSTIEKLAELFEVSPSYILGIEDNSENTRKIGSDFIRVPLYNSLCCGNGAFVDDNILEMIPVSIQGLKHPERCFAQFASGESMKDAGINDGDLLVFEKTPKVNSGVIGCFCIDDNEAVCKKYTESGSMVVLQPMNSDYDPIFVDPMNECFKCLGVLRTVVKNFSWDE